ncbi:MAG: undecaprenyl-phosphate glucose phosphotransferase [Parvularculaceae bacterium]
MAQTSLGHIRDFTADVGRRRAPVAPGVYGDLIQFIDFLLIIVASVTVAFVYHRAILDADFDFQRYAAAGIVGATGVTALLRRDGFYEFDQLLSAGRTLRPIVSRWALVILGLLAFAFSLKISDSFSRAWLFAWTGASVATLFATRVIAAIILRRQSREGGAFSRRVAIVGATALAEKFAEHIQRSGQGVSVVGAFDYDGRTGVVEDGPPVADDLNKLAQAARNGEIDDIVIAAPEAGAEEMDRLVRRLSILPVSIAICPAAHWLDHAGGEVATIGGASLLNLYRRPLEGWGGFIKMIEDRILAAAALILTSPLLLLIVLAVRMQGKGPILFSQKRHGFNHAVFNIYKFRTMTVCEDGEEIVQACLDDPRVTPVGKLLRRYSLDELPQLINVLRGDMSLVGPRPHALAHNHQYARTIENYSGRHKVKPGITGLAQVNGFRGETSENERMADRVRYDLEYIDNWSLWFDLKILALTVMAVLFPRNAH